MSTSLGMYEKLHMRHRFLRYRFRAERPSLLFLLGFNLDGCTALDVGANRGIYSYYMSKKVGENGRVISFEPIPAFADYLSKVKQAFKLHNVTVVDRGLSTSAGSARIGPGGNILEESMTSNPEAFDGTLVTLDSYMEGAKLPRVAFMKCDVEGHEYQVFKGGEATLVRDKPVLLFECAHDQATRGDLFGFLNEINYDGFFYYVSPRDHKNIFRRSSGVYVRAAEFRNYEYVANCNLRMYIFAAKGCPTWQRLSAAVGRPQPP